MLSSRRVGVVIWGNEGKQCGAVMDMQGLFTLATAVGQEQWWQTNTEKQHQNHIRKVIVARMIMVENYAFIG